MDSAIAKFLAKDGRIHFTATTNDEDTIEVLANVDLDTDEKPIVFFEMEDILFSLTLTELELLARWVYTLQDAIAYVKPS